MSLLDKATIITTPTAHSNGKLHSIKGGAVADFDVVRGSAATRVNAEGLIEDISVLSGELMTNGDFSNGSTGWGLGTGWSVVDGKVVADGTDSGVSGWLRQNDVITPSKKYKATFDITTNDSGVVLKINDSVSDIANIEGSGSKTIYFTSTGNHIAFSQITGKTASVTNVSVKEVIDATNIPRIDYTTGEGVILTEPQSTNLITYSEDFSQWSSGGGTQTVTQNATISPEGVNNASSIQINSGYVYKQVSGLTISNGDKYTWSCYVRSSSQKITFGGGTVPGTDIYSSEDAGNGWYKQKLTRTFLTDGAIIQPMFTESQSGTDLFYIWGAQLEALPYSTSYIPTSGAIATRLADSVTGAGDATTINSTEGVLYAEIAFFNDIGQFRSISINGGALGNRVCIENRPTANQIKALVVVSGVEVMSSAQTLTNVKSFNKMAIKWKQNDFSWYVNGVKMYSDLSGAAFSNGALNRLDFNGGASNIPFEGKTKTIAVFSEALTDEELTCLTTI